MLRLDPAQKSGPKVCPASTTVGHHYAGGVTWSDVAPPRLPVRTVEIADPGDLLGLLPPTDSYAWVRNGEGMVAWGEVVRHKASGVA